MRRIMLGAAGMTHLDHHDPALRFENLEALLAAAERHIIEGARLGCDFLCLPELFANTNRPEPSYETAEAPDGPIASFLSEMARRHSMILVTTILLRRDGKITNTGVFYGRDGTLLGTYDKVHLPEREAEICTPGEGFPVHDIEGVRVGMQICYDLNWPEGCRCLTLDGADIIFWPTMWGTMPEAFTEIILRARAMENLVWIVSSSYFLGGFYPEPRVFGRSVVVSWSGTILAEVGRRLGVAAATIDLDEPRYSQSPREVMLQTARRPQCYHRLVE